MVLVTKKMGLSDEELARFKSWRRAQSAEEEEEQAPPSRSLADQDIPTLSPAAQKRWDDWANRLITKAIVEHRKRTQDFVVEMFKTYNGNLCRDITKAIGCALAHERKLARLEIAKAVVRLLARKTPEELRQLQKQKHAQIAQLERELAAMEEEDA